MSRCDPLPAWTQVHLNKPKVLLEPKSNQRATKACTACLLGTLGFLEERKPSLCACSCVLVVMWLCACVLVSSFVSLREARLAWLVAKGKKCLLRTRSQCGLLLEVGP